MASKNCGTEVSRLGLLRRQVIRSVAGRGELHASCALPPQAGPVLVVKQGFRPRGRGECPHIVAGAALELLPAGGDSGVTRFGSR